MKILILTIGIRSKNETDMKLSLIRELISARSTLSENIEVLDETLKALKESSKEIMQMSEDVRQKANNTIS